MLSCKSFSSQSSRANLVDYQDVLDHDLYKTDHGFALCNESQGLLCVVLDSSTWTRMLGSASKEIVASVADSSRKVLQMQTKPVSSGLDYPHRGTLTFEFEAISKPSEGHLVVLKFTGGSETFSFTMVI